MTRAFCAHWAAGVKGFHSESLEVLEDVQIVREVNKYKYDWGTNAYKVTLIQMENMLCITALHLSDSC